jgi:hypothetical protein
MITAGPPHLIQWRAEGYAPSFRGEGWSRRPPQSAPCFRFGVQRNCTLDLTSNHDTCFSIPPPHPLILRSEASVLADRLGERLSPMLTARGAQVADIARQSRCYRLQVTPDEKSFLALEQESGGTNRSLQGIYNQVLGCSFSSIPADVSFENCTFGKKGHFFWILAQNPVLVAIFPDLINGRFEKARDTGACEETTSPSGWESLGLPNR